MRPAIIMLTPTERLDCLLRNVSRTGAMVSLSKDLKLPRRFVLDMSGNIAVRRLCTLVWQDGRNAGVSFGKLNRFDSIQFSLR